MLWFRVRKAEIDSELRKTFERYGRGTMQIVLGSTNYFQHNGAEQRVDKYRDQLLAWLTEEYDKEERRQTWSIAITLFVGVELLITVFSRHSAGLVRRLAKTTEAVQ
jgi:ABC-type transport system involved in cytochrome bd biosynthesis fused ATPase/permease subunit